MSLCDLTITVFIYIFYNITTLLESGHKSWFVCHVPVCCDIYKQNIFISNFGLFIQLHTQRGTMKHFRVFKQGEAQIFTYSLNIRTTTVNIWPESKFPVTHGLLHICFSRNTENANINILTLD